MTNTPKGNMNRYKVDDKAIILFIIIIDKSSRYLTFWSVYIFGSQKAQS